MLFGLAGCANGLNVPDGTAAFKDGYVDGCHQGYFDGGYHIRTPYNGDREKTDPDYGDGWTQGHARCYALQLAAPHIIGAGGGIGP